MENNAHAFWAGLFTIVLLCVGAAAVIWFNVDPTVRVPYELVTRHHVTGLSPDAAVRYRGLDIGKVQTIRFDPARPGVIVIRILVTAEAPVTRSTYGSLSFQGVTGLAFIQLDDTGRDPSRLPSSVLAVAQLPLHPSMLEQFQQRGDALLAQMEAVVTNVNALLSGDMREQMVATAGSVRQAAGSIEILSKQLGPATVQLPQTMRRLDHVLLSMDALSQTFNDLGERVRDDTLPGVDRLGARVGDTSRTLQSVATDLGRDPRRILFGSPGLPPGPGEPGFVWPHAVSRETAD